MIGLIMLLFLAGCASQAPGYYKPPAGLNEYAKMQDYLGTPCSMRRSL